MPVPLRDFFIVLTGSAGVLGVVYLGITLIFGQTWIDSNALAIFTHGLYWLLIPPAVWAVRFRKEDQLGFISPKIKMVMDNGLIITEPCEWMGHRTALSVFKMQDEVEIFQFSAYVVNVQSNSIIQIFPIQGDEDPIDINHLRENKEKIIFKPGQML